METTEFIAYLKDTLIPDLRESGYECTADDFDRCVDIIASQCKTITTLLTGS